MIESSESKEVKQDYLEILDAILKKIKASGQSQGFDPSNEISILVGSKSVYKGSIGQEPTRNKLTSDSVEAIRKAISEPQNLKGSVQIKIGRENVYHVKDGKVINDRLGFDHNQKQSVEQKPTANIDFFDDFQKQIDSLQSKVESQQKLIDTLKSQPQTSENLENISTEVVNLRQAFEQQQKTIEKLTHRLDNAVKSVTPAIKNSQLQNWVGAVETKVKQTATHLYNQAKTVLTPKADKLRSQIESQINDLKSQVNQQIKGLEKEIQSQVEELRSQIQIGGQNVREEVDQRIDSAKTSVSAAAKNFQHKVVGQVQTVHSEVTKMAQDTHSKAVNTVQESVQAVSESVMEAKGKAIEASVGAMLRLFGDTKADGSVSFESQNYHFHQQGNTISIKSKDGRDVLTDGALTSSASEQDIKTLEQVQPIVNEHLSNNTNLSESQSSRIRR